MTQLSEHFALSELVNPADGDPPPEVKANLTRLCRDGLEPLRAKAIDAGLTTEEEGLHIDSGWRPPAHNAATQGAVNGSEHIKGKAADVFTLALDQPNGERQIHLAALASRVPEIGGIGFYHDQTCCHVDIRPRVDGKIAHWYEESEGVYVATPQWLIDKFIGFGGVNLL